MQERIVWQSTGATVRQLLNSLDINRSERRVLKRDARRRSTRGPWRSLSRLAYWWIAGSCSFGIAMVVPSVIERFVLNGFSFSLEIVLGFPLLLILLWFAWWYFDRWETPQIRPALLQVLVEHGYRICRRCGYNLRDLSEEIDECPECGTYITRREFEHGEEPPLLEHPDNLASQIHTIVVGGNVPTSEIESAILIAREHQKARTKRINRVTGNIFVFGMLAAFCGALLLQQLIPSFPRFVTLLMVFGILVALIVCVMPTWIRVNREFITLARDELRRRGFDVCGNCGQYLGECDDTVNVCPSCKSPRKPLPGSCA